VGSRGEEQAYFLTRPITVIGRATEADLRVNDPGVSRKHAEIRVAGEEISIADLGSTNGLRVNGATVARHRLQNGDRVELGSTTLVFRIDED
jgi:pSer/pThr/pTyr-binding forkhead associated (FHA) protein